MTCGGVRPTGVKVVATDTFAEMYRSSMRASLDAVAEAEYYALDGRVIPSHGPEVVLIDLHDLTPGEREESVFVVRDLSTNLLLALNRFIAKTRPACCDHPRSRAARMAASDAGRLPRAGLADRDPEGGPK